MKIPTFLGVAGLIAVYIFLSKAGYLPNDKTEADLRIEKQRKVLLAEVKSSQTKQATTYAWVNKEKGVVRIPIERAMELAVKELQAK
jgi:hypothetical protein